MTQKFHNSSDKTVAAVNFSNGNIDASIILNDAVSTLLLALREHGTVSIGQQDLDHVVPEALHDAFGDKPILFFFYLDQYGFHITAKQTTSENYPIFATRRVGKQIRVYSRNDEAMNILITLMGNGARAIIKGMQDAEGFYVEPTCRPAGRVPQEMYIVSYREGEGQDAFMDRQTVTREELLDFIDNPKLFDLTVTKA